MPPASPPSLVLAGGYPPPLGGVTVHIAGLAERAAQAGFTVTVLNQVAARAGRRHPLPGVTVIDLPPSPGQAVPALLGRTLALHPGILHLHVSYLARAPYIGIPLLRLGPRGGRLLTLHSGSFTERWRSGGRVFRGAVTGLLRQADRVILVNRDMADLVRSEVGIGEERLLVIPAFLTPPPSASSPEWDRVVESVRPEGGRVAVVAGTFQPHYGFGEALDSLEINGLSRRLGLIFATYGRSFPEDEATVREKATRHRCIFLKDLSTEAFADLLRAAGLFLRPTDRDGDSMALREALSLSAQVVASDAAPRPPGVVTWRSGNPSSLEAALSRVLADPQLGKGEVGADAWASLLPLYRDALEGRLG